MIPSRLLCCYRKRNMKYLKLMLTETSPFIYHRNLNHLVPKEAMADSFEHRKDGNIDIRILQFMLTGNEKKHILCNLCVAERDLDKLT